MLFISEYKVIFYFANQNTLQELDGEDVIKLR